MDRVFGNMCRALWGLDEERLALDEVQFVEGVVPLSFSFRIFVSCEESVCVCTCVYVCARLDSRDSLSGTMFRLSIVFEDSSGVFLSLSLSLCISIRLVSLFRDSTRFRGLCVPCLAVCNGASESKACFCQAVERGKNGRILGCGERLYRTNFFLIQVDKSVSV